MSDQASLSGRYATALFGLACDNQQIDAVSRSLESLSRALAESPDLARLVSSPLVQRNDADRAMAALAPTLQIDPLTANFLGVLATNGRLHELGKIIASIRALAAAHLIATARAMGLTRVSLETGNSPLFAAANRLYQRQGFEPSDAFGDYPDSPFTLFYSRAL